jgi:hypothetical protein
MKSFSSCDCRRKWNSAHDLHIPHLASLATLNMQPSTNENVCL